MKVVVESTEHGCPKSPPILGIWGVIAVTADLMYRYIIGVFFVVVYRIFLMIAPKKLAIG
jgi:hypothetical protein